MSRICEEFSCTPLEALQQPEELTRTILVMRNYARAKEAVDDPKRENDMANPFIQMVWDTTAELVKNGRP